MRKFLLSGLLLLAIPCYSQLSMNLDHAKSKRANSRSLGLNMQYLLRVGCKAYPGISAGVAYRNEDGEDNISIPLNLHYRHYLLGSSRCFGLYAEAVGGPNFIRPINQEEGVRDTDFQTAPQLMGALGFNVPIGIDFNFRYGGEYHENQFNPFVGFKLGYVF